MTFIEESTSFNVHPKFTETSGEAKFPNPDPVSSQVQEIVRTVVFVYLCGLLSLIGIATNVVNMIVFIRQGFKDSINMSLLGLAIADFGCAVTMLFISISFNPLLFLADLKFSPVDVGYLVGGWPHACFNRVTSLITVFITMERCLCIARPLKVKAIITPRRTKIIITSIYLAMVVFFMPSYFVNRLAWVHNQHTNRTILSLVYSENRVIVETITCLIHSVMIPDLALSSVIIFTIILIVELNQKQKWRQTSSAAVATSKPDSSSTKEKKVVKMVTVIAILFIVFYTPASVNFFIMSWNPEFSFTGMYANVYIVVWSFTGLLQTVSFSINFFIYFSMSSKFKTTLLQTINGEQHRMEDTQDTQKLHSIK